jgi:hypothetical protein
MSVRLLCPEGPSIKLEVHLWQRHVEVRADDSEEPVQLSIAISSDFTFTPHQPFPTPYISPRARRQAYLPPSLEERRLEPSMELPKPRATMRDGAASFGALGAGFFTAFLTFCATPLVVGFCLDSSMTSSSCCAESDLAGAALALVSWSCCQFGYVGTRAEALGERIGSLTSLLSSHSEISEGQSESSDGENVLGFGGDLFGVMVDSFFCP